MGDGTFDTVSPAESGIVVPEDAKSTLATDLDGDGRLDIVVATNDGPVRTFTVNQAFIEMDEPNSQVKVERYLGSGYLSSGSTPWLQNQPVLTTRGQ